VNDYSRLGTRVIAVSGIGIGRTVLASATCLTLLANNPAQLAPIAQAPGYSLFLVLPLPLARALAIGGLLLVMIGWRPRLTCLLHAWITFSFATSFGYLDGGDQVAQVLSLFLVPILLVDSRRWHWTPVPAVATQGRDSYLRFCFWGLRLQVAAIYGQAALGKVRVDEWIDGTALYIRDRIRH